MKAVTRIYYINLLIEKKKNEILLWFVDLKVGFLFNLKKFCLRFRHEKFSSSLKVLPHFYYFPDFPHLLMDIDLTF